MLISTEVHHRIPSVNVQVHEIVEALVVRRDSLVGTTVLNPLKRNGVVGYSLGSDM